MGSVVSILMKVFPKYVMTIASFTETLFGLGYMIGIWNADVVELKPVKVEVIFINWVNHLFRNGFALYFLVNNIQS